MRHHPGACWSSGSVDISITTIASFMKTVTPGQEIARGSLKDLRLSFSLCCRFGRKDEAPSRRPVDPLDLL